MNTEKTPLIQKLILAVLTLILICLVVLIAQNQSGRQVMVTEAAPSPEPVEEVVAAVSEPEVVAPAVTQRVSRPLPRQPHPTFATTPPAPAVPTAAIEPQPVQQLPPSTVTLVNPVRPQPLDIAIHPHTPVLNVALCGLVRLEGVPPPEVPIRLTGSCARLNEGPFTTRHYVVGPNSGLANVLVYIKDEIPKAYHPPTTNAPLVTATRCFYEPYVQGMYVEQKLTIHNLDPMLHNFHVVARHNRQVNFSVPTRNHKREISFDRPETFIRLKCDVHAWEFAYVGVIAHPFFSVTDTNGIFCLPAGLPHGQYTLAAVHPKAGETLQQIVITDEPPRPVELAFTVGR